MTLKASGGLFYLYILDAPISPFSEFEDPVVLELLQFGILRLLRSYLIRGKYRIVSHPMNKPAAPITLSIV